MENYRERFGRIIEGDPLELSQDDIDWMRKRTGWWSDGDRAGHAELYEFFLAVNQMDPMSASEAMDSEFRNLPDEAVQRLGVEHDAKDPSEKSKFRELLGRFGIGRKA